MNLARAYSWIDIKAFDEKKRTLEGTATTPSPDRMADRVNPLGAEFELPIPFLWQHRHDSPAGSVIDADVKSTGIKFKAEIAQTDEPGKLKDFLDFVWQSLKLKLVRATSIGFAPLQWSFIENGGIDYEKWSWLELSGVTIPANPDAVISQVKSIDRIYREVAGIPEFDIPQPEAPALQSKSVRVVKLNPPADPSVAPFVVREIKRT